MSLTISSLISGGLITNYYCTSSCKHCLYNCSPFWPKQYIDKETAIKAFKIAKGLGCDTMHIGGGEPFLNKKGLLEVVHAAKKVGIHIEYIETNSSWFTDEDRAIDYLLALKKEGISRILVSISPFHVEYIPLKKVLGVISACQKVGMGIFPWTSEYLNMFLKLDPEKRYTLKDLEDIFGKGFIRDIPKRYWIHPGGRALKYFFDKGKPLKELINRNKKGCMELFDTSHFHIDLFGNYIPGLCAGIKLKATDLGKAFDKDRYPIINILAEKGVRGLYEYACSLGLKMDEKREFGSKCTLCNEIRLFLFKKGVHERELGPREYYSGLLN